LDIQNTSNSLNDLFSQILGGVFFLRMQIDEMLTKEILGVKITDSWAMHIAVGCILNRLVTYYVYTIRQKRVWRLLVQTVTLWCVIFRLFLW